MLEAKNVLTIGTDYRVVHGGVAAVENVYSTFYKPFNHVTTVTETGQIKKLFVLCYALPVFLGWMMFRPEIKIVHVHGASKASFWRKSIFIYIAKSFGKKVVYHMHGGGFEEFTKRHPFCVGKLVKKCDVIIALSEYWKNYFTNKLHCNNVVIVKNVIASPVVDKKDRRDFSLLFLGLLGKNKGIYDLLACLNEHKDEFNGRIKLYVGGNGEVQKVVDMIDKYGLNNVVSFEGWVSGKDKIKLFNIADAYILPSYHEGLPISILEAMSYSLPIISTNVGGIPEILKDGENGFLITPGDKDAMYHAIHSLMNSREICGRMGEESKKKVQEHLPRYVENQLSELYENLLGGGKYIVVYVEPTWVTSSDTYRIAC